MTLVGDGTVIKLDSVHLKDLSLDSDGCDTLNLSFSHWCLPVLDCETRFRL